MLDKHEKAVQNGVIAAIFIATFTTFAIVAALLADDVSSTYNDPFMLIDVGIFALLAWWLNKHSRTAAILLLLYYVSLITAHFLLSQSFAHLLLAPVFIYILFKAILSTFAIHRREKENGTTPRKRSKLKLFLAGTGTAFVLIGVFFTILLALGVLQSGRVLTNDQVSDDLYEKLVEHQVLYPHENIERFYAGGLFDELESGVILSSDNVISYETTHEGLQVYEMPIAKITNISHEEEWSYFGSEAYYLSSDSPELWLIIFLPSAYGDDQAFISDLQKKVDSGKQPIKVPENLYSPVV